MKKYALAIAIAVFAVGIGISNASAGATDPNTDVPDRDPDRLVPRCVQIGSDIWECEKCVESNELQMTVCYPYISKNETKP